ncbi:MAG TPA: type I-D CRISPR-associated protein Cas7/Csc2 [Pyrinomonadaceae bacterium]|nr:type I-D CRISPR-associated protein Cas7/Csc2 [Pyrinomonadaceae bacterium]
MQLSDFTTLQVADYRRFLMTEGNIPIPKYRQGRYIQVVVLRETKSHAIFTTEGQTLDVEVLQAGLHNTQAIDRIVMYKRKQIAPERRTGRALSRARGFGPVEDKKDAKGKVIVPQGECEIMGNACGLCADCILYGFAATTGTASQKARVLTDSGFVIRSQDQVMRDIKLNAIQETTAGGIAGSAYAHRENVLPQVFLPTAETLLDVTPPEFIYVLSNILMTTRYGAESNREGFVRNHILGIYFSEAEVFSNLELTQRFYDALAVSAPNANESDPKQVPDYLAHKDFQAKWKEVAETSLKATIGQVKRMTDEHLAALVADTQKLYADEGSLTKFLRELHQQAFDYATQIKGKATPSEEENESTEESSGEEA